MTDTAGGRPAIYDAEMIAQIRSAYAQAEGDERWSIRLTLGEVAALLRAVDARDDALRRLVGEWEGDVFEPLPAVTVVEHDYDDELAPAEIPHPIGYIADAPLTDIHGVPFEPFIVNLKEPIEKAFPYQCQKYPGIRHTAYSAKTCCRPDVEYTEPA